MHHVFPGGRKRTATGYRPTHNFHQPIVFRPAHTLGVSVISPRFSSVPNFYTKNKKALKTFVSRDPLVGVNGLEPLTSCV